MPEFKHLGKQGFPHGDNVDVYKYDNQFDYSRYDYDQMKITVCSVPWDMGEAHIGNRLIEGVGNVVHFGSKAKRDEWFENIPDSECFRWETKYKELHRDNYITVPLPFDVAARYNYVFVQYHLFANDNSPVQYEDSDGIKTWCYFVRNVEFVSPNTTKLELMDDTWQTFIYDVDITGMILERGHAPMYAIDADSYLSNPIENSKYLLADDVNFGELQKVTHIAATGLNADNMYACIVTSGYVTGDWGSKANDDWHTPAPAHATVTGAPSFYVMALPAEHLNNFLTNVKDNTPQFMQTVQAVFFLDRGYMTLGEPFTFGGQTCYLLQSTETQEKQLITLAKSQFGYDSNYADIAKLYTWPYAALEITDEKGNTNLVHIEETTGTIGATVAANAVFPYINLQAILSGIGGNASVSVSFQNVSERSFDFSGRWYDHLMQWEIPTFAVLLQSSTHYDYDTHFERLQMENDRSTTRDIAERDTGNTRTNADASATTASNNAQNIANAAYSAAVATANASKSAADTQADAEKAIADNNAQNTLDNAAAQTTCNSTVTAKANQESTSDANLANALQQALQAWDAGYSRATTNMDNDAAWFDAGISSASGIIGSAAAGGVSGMTLGPAGAALGAIGGLVSGAFGAATTAATTAVSTNLTSSKTEAGISNSQSKVTATQNNNTERTNTANNCRTGQNNATNTMISTSANNTASAMRENGSISQSAQKTAASAIQNGTISAADITRDAQVAAAQATESTEKANNRRTFDTSTNDYTDTYNNAGNRIENLVRQAALDAPLVYGSIGNGETSTTKPQAIFANVVTEPNYAIANAGDEFLRYGYYLNQYWDFDGNWNVGKHFTYWKLKDYWVNSNAMQDQYQDAIRFFLMGGVTVWNDPNEIGKVSIYDN